MILSTPDPALDRAFTAALLRLQQDAYRRQAELIGSDRLDSLSADEDTLPAWRGHYLVAWNGTRLLGAIAWRPGQVADVDRVMVDPPSHRCGVASRLLETVLEMAGDVPVATFTGRDNVPGLRLYGQFGFEPVADEQSPAGIWITRLRREPGQR